MNVPPHRASVCEPRHKLVRPPREIVPTRNRSGFEGVRRCSGPSLLPRSSRLFFAPAAYAADEDWRPEGHDSAVAACLDFNEYKPANLVDAAEDGLGDWIVWVKDKDGDLWLCNANSGGEVYANVLLNGDLLDGDGTSMLADSTAAGDSARRTAPSRLCTTVGDYMEDLEIVATVDDALGDYLVWLKNGDGAYWMCNASSDAKLYSFESVQYPIDAAATSDDGTCCAPFEDRRVSNRIC